MHTTFGVDVPDDMIIDGTSDSGDRAGGVGEVDLRLVLAESVAGFGKKYPDVQVTRRIARGLTDQGLLRAMASGT